MNTLVDIIDIIQGDGGLIYLTPKQVHVLTVYHLLA